MSLELQKYLNRVLTSGSPDIDDANFLKRLKEQTDYYIFRKVEREKSTTLKDAVRIYESNLHTVELVSNTWQIFWDLFNHRTGSDIKVQLSDLTNKKIMDLENAGRMVIYLPPEVSSIKSVKKLLVGIREYAERGNREVNNLINLTHLPHHYDAVDYIISNYENIGNSHGWLHTENSVDTPNKGFSPDEIKNRLENNNRMGLTINTHLILVYFNLYRGYVTDNTNGIASLSRLCGLTETVDSQGNFLLGGSCNPTNELIFAYRTSRSEFTQYEKQQLGYRTAGSINTLYQKRFEI